MNGKSIHFSGFSRHMKKVRYIPGNNEKPGVMKFTYKDRSGGTNNIFYTFETHVLVPSQYNQKAKEAANAIIREYGCYSL